MSDGITLTPLRQRRPSVKISATRRITNQLRRYRDSGNGEYLLSAVRMSLADGVLSQEVAAAFTEACERWENGRMDPTDCESERVTHLGQAFGVPPREKGFRPSGKTVKIPLAWNDELDAMPRNVGEEVYYLVQTLLDERSEKGIPARHGRRKLKHGARRWITGADPDRNVFDEAERRLGLPARTVKAWYYELKSPPKTKVTD